MEELKRITYAKEAENPFYLNDPKLLEIYNKCLPPKESYYYFPKGEEIITINSKKPLKSIRRVYYNIEYKDFEIKLLNEFKQLLNKHTELKLPDFFLDYYILMFAYARGGDLEESYKMVVEYLEFSNKMFPMTVTPDSKIIEILNKGFIYVYGRDNRFRPIIVCQAKVFQKYHKEYKFEELLQAVSFMAQFVINRLLLPGQFETWNMIVNLKGVSVISLPDSLKKLIPALSKYFICKLNKNFIIGLNFITRILYKIAVNFIDPVTKSKNIVLEGKGDPNLFKFIRPDNIEEQFGGTAPNMPVDKENGYFPPRMPSEHFIKDEENKDNILISEEEYIKRYKEGKIPIETVSPYIYHELKQKEELEKLKAQEIENKIKEEEIKLIENKEKEKEEILQSNLIQNKIILEKQKIFDEKAEKIEKVKKFVNYNWKIDEESNKKIVYNSDYIKRQNIIKDINNFGMKRQKFSENIFLINK